MHMWYLTHSTHNRSIRPCLEGSRELVRNPKTERQGTEPSLDVAFLPLLTWSAAAQHQQVKGGLSK